VKNRGKNKHSFEKKERVVGLEGHLGGDLKKEAWLGAEGKGGGNK